MRGKNYSNFGASVASALTERQLTQSTAASATGRTVSYLNQTMTGRKSASAEWCDLVASALELDDTRRGELHRAAAKDHGFKIDLTK